MHWHDPQLLRLQPSPRPPPCPALFRAHPQTQRKEEGAGPVVKVSPAPAPGWWADTGLPYQCTGPTEPWPISPISDGCCPAATASDTLATAADPCSASDASLSPVGWL